MDKDEVVARILQAEGRGKTVIFTKTKRQAAKVADELSDRGFSATALHGDMSQEAREKSMDAFRSGKRDILVATEVAARGIDVDDVTHVINYTVPEDEKAYLHRTGRTGRAGRTGIAVTFVDWEDLARWSHIDKALELNTPDPIETYSSSPHLFTDLDIPAGTKGRIAATKRPSDWKPGDHEKPKGQRGGNTGKPQRKPQGNSSKPQGSNTQTPKTPSNRPPRNRTRTRKTSE
jgi:superfamily II DNA/RNA helicase